MVPCVSRISAHLLLVLGLTLPSANAAYAQETSPDSRAFALIAGGPGDAETAFATEMADLFPNEATPRVERGDAGFNNIVQLLSDPKIGAAFVSTDALAHARDVDLGGKLEDRLALVARLGPQEVHVLARREIADIADLAGKRVSFGPSGSSAAITAASVFAALKIAVEPVDLDAGRAMKMLEQGEIAGLVRVGGKPLPLVATLTGDANIHLLPIPFDAALQEAYLPTRFEHGDYPDLVAADAEVPTIATGLVLLAARDKGDPAYDAWLETFTGTFFAGFAALEESGRHPKWREVNLAASLPGFQRADAASAWLNKQPIEKAEKGQDANRATTAPALPAAVSMSEEQKKALFQEFIEWRRARQH